MKRCIKFPARWVAIGALLLLPAGPGLRGAPDAGAPDTLPALEGLVRQWLDLRAQTAQEDRAWQEQQRVWQRELTLLEEEKAQLETRQHEMDRNRQASDAEYESLRGERDGLRHLLRRLQPLLADIETHLRAMAPLVPAGVAPELHAALTALPGADETVTPRDPVNVPERLQRLLALLAELESLQNAVHIGRELVEVDGARRELEVLYLGLAAAYACSEDGRVGAIGRPTTDGWRWRSATEVAAEVRTAAAILKREQPARWLHLPITIEDVP